MGEVKLLHKKGDKSNVDYYRGITLLSAFGKCAHINGLISPFMLFRSFSNFQQI